MDDLLHKLSRFIEIRPNPRKLLNYALNKLSKYGVSGYALGIPHYFFLEVTNSCNLSCKLCPVGNGSLKRKKARIIFNDFKKIIDKVCHYMIKIGIGGFGEPFLNEDIYRMLEYIKHKRIFVEVYTNLFCLDKEDIVKIVDYKVDKLVISLDASDANLYLHYKGVDGFHKVMDNLKYLVGLRTQKHQKKPLLDLQFIMLKDNTIYKEDIERLAQDIGVDILSLKTPNLYLGNLDNYPSKKEQENFLSEDFNRYKVNNSRLLPCSWVWNSLIIYANGDVGPCCYDAQGDYIFGNILLDDIGNIWNSKKYRQFRINATERIENLCILCMERHKGLKIKIEYPINKLRLRTGARRR